MLASGWIALCSLLVVGGQGLVERDAQTGRPRAAPPAVKLAISTGQREAVRGAASAYRGTPVSIIVHRATASDRTFVEGFSAALRAAGLDVSVRVDDTYAPVSCPDKPGLRVMYGAVRSGAVNAIAEALIRARVLSDSLTGCRVDHEDALIFIVSGGSP